jgi:hypothetical protein
MRGLSAYVIVILLSLVPQSVVPASCPDVVQFRSSFVRAAFNHTKMAGVWYTELAAHDELSQSSHPLSHCRYEHAYIDPAQLGSRCQRLVGDVSSGLKVLRGFIADCLF